MSERRLKTALIGVGMVARTHLAACADAQNVDLVGVWARDHARAGAFAKEAADVTGAPVATLKSLADVAASDIDFAIILTPPNARASVIDPLAKAGKHILLEKPVGRTAKEAREVLKLCRDADVTLGIVFQHRMRAASLKAQELISAGAFGTLGLVEISVPWWREQGYYDEPGRGTYARDGGGVLISQAIHTIDLALSLAGPVASVRAMAATTRFHNMEAEDFVVAGLQFSSGAVGSLTASTASFPGGAESIIMHFDNASLHLQSGKLRVQWRDGCENVYGEDAATGGGADPMAFTHDWHQAILEDFADALIHDREPIVSGDAALQAHELIDAIVHSAKRGNVQELAE